jgi:hypothetical protein
MANTSPQPLIIFKSVHHQNTARIAREMADVLVAELRLLGREPTSAAAL